LSPRQKWEKDDEKGGGEQGGSAKELAAIMSRAGETKDNQKKSAGKNERRGQKVKKNTGVPRPGIDRYEETTEGTGNSKEKEKRSQEGGHGKHKQGKIGGKQPDLPCGENGKVMGGGWDHVKVGKGQKKGEAGK